MDFSPRASSFDALSQRYGAHRYRWLVLLVLGLGAVSSLLASTSFTVAVPSLMKHFNVGQTQVQWTITGFMAAMTVGMLPTSWLLDHLGARKLFLGAIAVLAASGLAGAFATNFTLVVALRILQGATAGVLQPLTTIAVMRLFPVEEQGRATGILGFGIILAPAMAPTFGGMLLDRFGWPAIFLMNLPACVAAAVMGFYLLPLPRENTHRRFDWIGLAMLTVVSLAIVEAVASLQHSGLTSSWTLILFAVAILTLTGFIFHAKRTEHPIISLSPFAERIFTMGTLVTFAYGFGLYASTYLIPVFLQHAMHLSATAAGLALLPSGLVLAVTIPLAGRMADRHSPLLVTIAGLTMFFLSFAFFAIVAAHITYPEVVGGAILGRIGLGFILPALSIATLRPLKPEQIGQSSVVVSYVRQLGGVMGVAVSAAFVSWREAAYEGVSGGVFSAYAESFMLVAGFFLLAIIAAYFMKQNRMLGVP
ncbi:EmrB/QacA subfamily drug resistance transporter [Paucimonas lemoignei]|uniref:EmrB/QacA subfamily drug resistance transporter n=1 Tax=Paucimonas lemoignei TaxID=29443 RepID=A0A4R3HU33_PAULE|nr:DHA2 family efflux MFS transporter permease subunit [Paucimonas lemoignei]TCS36538.1 EmrB/QacA subfamily drug resistance transporter [Paucimonas lemoignei]